MGLIGMTWVVFLSCTAGFAQETPAFRTVWVLGTNTEGQLGDGSVDHNGITPYRNPKRVEALPDIQSVRCDDCFLADVPFNNSQVTPYIIALDAGGDVWAWRTNFHGELGRPTTAAGVRFRLVVAAGKE